MFSRINIALNLRACSYICLRESLDVALVYKVGLSYVNLYSIKSVIKVFTRIQTFLR